MNILDSDIVCITSPTHPVYQTPSFFNKKKVEANNKKLKEEYEESCRLYSARLLEEKEREIERRKQQNDLIQGQRQCAKSDLQEKISNLESKSCELSEVSHDKLVLDFYNDEIKEVEQLILDNCKARADLLSLQIIHGKYVDFVSETTILEYLETGRCSQLEGPDGAYNLYESEIRANRIISQLDQVLVSLEEIKANQYAAYSMLSDISYNVSNISNKMDTAIGHLKHISSNTDRIKESTERIEYYSEKNNAVFKTEYRTDECIGIYDGI